MYVTRSSKKRFDRLVDPILYTVFAFISNTVTKYCLANFNQHQQIAIVVHTKCSPRQWSIAKSKGRRQWRRNIDIKGDPLISKDFNGTEHEYMNMPPSSYCGSFRAIGAVFDWLVLLRQPIRVIYKRPVTPFVCIMIIY